MIGCWRRGKGWGFGVSWAGECGFPSVGRVDFAWSLWAMAYEGHFRGRLRLPLAR